MKVLFFADSHLGFDFPVRPRIERRRRGWDFFNNYHHILETAITENVDVLLHGGDVFFRSKIPKPVIEKVYEPLLKVLDSGIDVLLVPGNHERSRLPTTPLFRHPQLRVFDRPRTILISQESISVAFGGFPNIRNDVAGEFAGAVDASCLLDEHANFKILCLHQSIEDAVVGVQNYRFRKGRDVIGKEQFPADLDLILSGHIHRQQILRSTEGTPIIYPGSIERTSFAERLETKGYYMIEISETGIDWEFRELPARPMLEISLPEALSDESALIKAIQSRLPSIPDDAIVRIRCATETQVQSMKISRLREIFPDSVNVDIALPPGVTGSRRGRRSDGY